MCQHLLHPIRNSIFRETSVEFALSDVIEGKYTGKPDFFLDQVSGDIATLCLSDFSREFSGPFFSSSGFILLSLSLSCLPFLSCLFLISPVCTHRIFCSSPHSLIVSEVLVVTLRSGIPHRFVVPICKITSKFLSQDGSVKILDNFVDVIRVCCCLMFVACCCLLYARSALSHFRSNFSGIRVFSRPLNVALL